MQKELINLLMQEFESYANITEDGVEFWLARDLQVLLGYGKWENFEKVIKRAMQACELSGQNIVDHFPDVRKTIEMPKGAEKTISDYMLTRYACYLIAQNGDSRKEKIAFAQTYFAVQTRKLEIIEKRISEFERITARKKLAQSEKELSSVIFEQTGGGQNFGIIISKGDKALFANSTNQMKARWKVSSGRALADYAPTIILKAKDFATEITIFNAKENFMQTEREISREHVVNNTAVRNTLIERGIHPESLAPEEDIKKVERKLKSESKKGLDKTKAL